jgi:hypothetical protein
VSSSIFEQLDSTLTSNGPAAAAQMLADRLRSQGRYPELFEILKMQSRIELGLPAVHNSLNNHDSPREGLSDELQTQLDQKLLSACREVGMGLLRAGKLQEGWMYMRAVDDREAAAEALRDIHIDQDNLDEVLGLLIHEAIDVKRGTELSLRMRGTCNTITMLESVIAMRGRREQQEAVQALVRHVHSELLRNVKDDLVRRESWSNDHPDRNQNLLQSLLASRPTLLRDGSYHIDTTHLASTVRFARILDDSDCLALAQDLAIYGKDLHPQYHYPSEEPFADLYPMSLAMFRAVRGEHVDAALKLFLQKAESLDTNEHGTIAIETYVDLLTRVGRPQAAMEFLVKKMPQGMRPFGIAPSLIELAEAANNYDLMLDQSRQKNDEVGYAAALLQRATSAGSST